MGTDVKRGDIYYIAPYYAVGSEQWAGRPAIIVSNDCNNECSETYEVVYLTTQEKHDLPTHVTITSAKRTSTALCEQINTVAKERLGDYYGSISEDEAYEMNKALAKSISLVCPSKKQFEDGDCAEKLALAEKRYDRLKSMYDDLMTRFINGETEAN